jgi:hypothetical protein
MEGHRASGRIRKIGTPDLGIERRLLDRFVAAWHACDIPAWCRC